MKKLGEAEYGNLVENANVLSYDLFGNKVLQLENGNILKLFRIKRKVTSARLLNYAQRFANNARRLQKLGINTVTMVDEFSCPHIDRQCVLYRPLVGITLRDAMNEQFEQERMNQFGSFIAELHDKGVYFRSMHLNNVVICPDGSMGLIDISDIRFQPWKMGLWKSLRNFKHIVNKRDAGVYWQTNMKQFREFYIAARRLPIWKKNLLRRKWPHYINIGAPL